MIILVVEINYCLSSLKINQSKSGKIDFFISVLDYHTLFLQ